MPISRLPTEDEELPPGEDNPPADGNLDDVGKEESPRIPLDKLAGPDGGEESRRLAAFWKDQVDEVDEVQKRWRIRGRKIEERYRDERKRSDDEGQQRRYNCLWANVEILTPVLFGQAPTPVAERRFKDKDPTGRAAATILERCLRSELDDSDMEGAVAQAVKDYLLPGRGSCWVRYEPEIEPGLSLPVEAQVDMADAQGTIEDPDEDEDELHLQETGDRVTRESVPVDHIGWTDFYMFPPKARKWKEVTAVGKRVFMTRDQMKERFGKQIGKGVPLQRSANDKRDSRHDVPTSPQDELAQKGEVYEIWNRLDKRVYWVAEGYEWLCDRKDDPLRLENFFPVPEPLQANTTNNTLVPVPDYIQYQDQALQIDELTQRIAMLTKACKIAGVYDASNKNIQRIFDESIENQLIPVDSWVALAEKGGVAGSISLLPLDQIIGTINELSQLRQSQIADMDRLTGITDIMRGTTDARETMGGQRLKSNGSNTRVSSRQRRVETFCLEIVRLQAEIISEHFSPVSMIEASGVMYDESLGGDKVPVPLMPDDVPDSLDSIMPSLRPPAPPPMQMGGPPGMPPGPPRPGGMQLPGPPALGAGPAAAPAGLAAGGPPALPAGNAPNAAPPGGPGVASIGAPPLGGVPHMSPPIGGAPPGPPMSGPALGIAPATMMPPPAPPQPIMVPRGLLRIMRAIDLLRNERLRGFRVEVDTDSTVYGDQQQDKADRMEFIGSVTKYLQTAMQMAAAMPESAPLLAKLLQFGVRGFHVGRDLEVAIDDFADEAEKLAKQRAAQGAQNDPKNAKAQADASKAQAEVQRQQLQNQGDMASAQAEVQRQNLENQGELQNSQMDLQGKQIEQQMQQREHELEREKLQLEQDKLALENKRIELEHLREQNKTAALMRAPKTAAPVAMQ